MDFNFEEMTDKVKDTIKKVPPWGWVALAGGGAVLVFLGTRTPAYTEPGIVKATTSSGGSAVGLGGGDSQSMSAGTDGVISQLAEDMKDLVAENNELDKAFNRVSNEFVSYQANTNKVLEQTQTTFNTLSSELAYQTTLADIPQIYFDGKRDDAQYTSIFNAVNTTPTLKTEQREELLNKTAGFGNDGKVDPNYKGETVTLADIKANADLLKTELDRTNRVIANRKEAGLDTKAQESWLKQLSTK